VTLNLDPYVAALIAGFAVCLFATFVLQMTALRLPSSFPLAGLRGSFEKAPPLGGIAILAAFAVTPFLAVLLSDKADEYFTPKRTEFLGFLGATSLVFLTGLIDDWRAMRPWQKLLGQLIAGIAVFAAGYQLEAIAFPWGGSLDLGFLALPATLLWVVFFTNAFNLIDGKDGLATGVGVFAAAALAAVAANTNHPAVALLFAGLAGAGLGFLPFNLPKAALFLGDSGALVFGFLLSTLAIRGATGVEGEVFVAVPLLALGFPVLDTLLSAARRLLDRRDPFSGDRDHIHHRLDALDLGPRGSLVVLYTLSAAFAGAALLTHYVASLVVEALVFIGLAGLIALVLGRLGYVVTLWNSDRVLSLRRRLTKSA
jgi:UDP-GlcNAc:undecaprenyl-phosphate/decaprenyl-phosphate GlcNAc-1-phosphate transferase